MTTRLEKPLKREISVGGKPYIVTLTPEGMKLTAKGKRKGQELSWEALLNGDAGLTAALNASVQQPR